MNPGETSALRMYCAWLMSWDYGAPEKLAAAIRVSSLPFDRYKIPDAMVPVIADIVAGRRRPRQHVTRLKIPARQIGEAAESLSRFREYQSLASAAEDWVVSPKTIARLMREYDKRLQELLEATRLMREYDQEP